MSEVFHFSRNRHRAGRRRCGYVKRRWRFIAELNRQDPNAFRYSRMGGRRIDLGTLTGLNENHHQLDAYCPRCDKWRVLPLAELVAQGHGLRRLPIAVRCQECGSPGQLHLRPPVPTRSPVGGWMEPH